MKNPRLQPTHPIALAPVQSPEPTVDGFVTQYLRNLNNGRGVALSTSTANDRYFALAATVPMVLAAAEQLATDGVEVEVVDLRCLIPLDVTTVMESVGRTSRMLVVEENPYQGGWGATLASLVADEGFELLDAPVRRLAGDNVPLPFADALEQQVIPTVDKVVAAVRRLVSY